MALGFIEETSGGSTDILPIVKFSAQSGDFIRQESVPDASGQYVKQLDELPLPLRLAFDFENIEVGYVSFQNGVDFRLVKLGEPMPAKPDEGDFKQVFRMRVANKDVGLCEFSHSAKTVRNKMNSLHDEYLSGKAEHPGKVPVVEISSLETIVVPTQQSDLRFKVPNWSIVDWIDRPAIMSGTAPEQVSAPSPTPAVNTGEEKPLF
jgi:hypothetical protein